MFQKDITLFDGADGFDGCIEVVQRTRGYRRWPDEARVQIVAELANGHLSTNIDNLMSWAYAADVQYSQ